LRRRSIQTSLSTGEKLSTITHSQRAMLSTALREIHSAPSVNAANESPAKPKQAARKTAEKPWFDRENRDHNVQSLYFRLVVSGRWPKIRNILLQGRTQTKKWRRNSENVDISPKRFNQHDRLKKVETRNPGVLPGFDHWGTSNPEWSFIKVIVARSMGHSQILRQHPRLLVDSIIEKFGTGKAWSEIAGRSGISKTTLIDAFHRLNCNGGWSEICAALCSVRSKDHDLDFPCRADGWHLSSSEWEVIRPIMSNGRDHRVSFLHRHPRLLVDSIIERFGTRSSWPAVAKQNDLSADVLRTSYRRLKSDGRWKDICSALRKMRGARSSSE
jgi:hypothetical protein